MFSSKIYRWFSMTIFLTGLGMGIAYWLTSFILAMQGTVTWNEIFMFDSAVGGKDCLPIPYIISFLRVWLIGGGMTVGIIGGIMLIPALKYIERKDAKR